VDRRRAIASLAALPAAVVGAVGASAEESPDLDEFGYCAIGPGDMVPYEYYRSAMDLYNEVADENIRLRLRLRTDA
jgi:hypothetical protein